MGGGGALCRTAAGCGGLAGSSSGPATMLSPTRKSCTSCGGFASPFTCAAGASYAGGAAHRPPRALPPVPPPTFRGGPPWPRARLAAPHLCEVFSTWLRILISWRSLQVKNEPVFRREQCDRKQPFHVGFIGDEEIPHYYALIQFKENGTIHSIALEVLFQMRKINTCQPVIDQMIPRFSLMSVGKFGTTLPHHH